MGPLARLAVVAALGGGLFAVLASGLVGCQFASVTGCPCPGCGLTRATLAIARGDLGAAFALQPFAFVVSPLVATSALGLARTYVTGQPWTSTRRLHAWLGPIFGGVMLAMIVFWAARFLGFWGGPAPV
jgi:hypothetical protein